MKTTKYTDKKYRGYTLRTYPEQTMIYRDGAFVDTVTLQMKDRHPTTLGAAMTLVDAWLDAK